MAKKKYYNSVTITDNKGKMPSSMIKGTYPDTAYLPNVGIDESLSSGDAFIKETQNAISKKPRK